MPNNPIYSSLADYLDALQRIQQVEQRQLATTLGLQTIHLQIINYLYRCNRYSDTLSTLCDFIGQTKGTISTSVALLVKKEMIDKQPDDKDGRIVHLQLTDAGKAVAKQQVKRWQQSQKLMSEDEQNQLVNGLQLFLQRNQAANAYRMFGACKSCQHLIREDKQQRCGLTGEALLKADLEKICVYHECD